MKATNYVESLMLADYYLDLGKDRVSDQIRYRASYMCFHINKLRYTDITANGIIFRKTSRASSRSVRNISSSCLSRGAQRRILSSNSTLSRRCARSASRSKNLILVFSRNSSSLGSKS